MKNLHPDQHHPTPTTPTPTHLPAKQVRRVSQDFKHKLKIFQQEQHADKNNESTESTESKWANNHPETKANREISNSKAIQDATSNLHNVNIFFDNDLQPNTTPLKRKSTLKNRNLQIVQQSSCTTPRAQTYFLPRVSQAEEKKIPWDQ